MEASVNPVLRLWSGNTASEHFRQRQAAAMMLLAFGNGAGAVTRRGGHSWGPVTSVQAARPGCATTPARDKGPTTGATEGSSGDSAQQASCPRKGAQPTREGTAWSQIICSNPGSAAPQAPRNQGSSPNSLLFSLPSKMGVTSIYINRLLPGL